MGKIIQFPEKRKHQLELEKEINNLAESLKELYDAIRTIELGQNSLQQQAYSMEESYQELIQLYADIIGTENVPADMLEYCIFVGMEKDPITGKITITFEPPNGPDGVA